MSKNGEIIALQKHFHSSFPISGVLIHKINMQPFFPNPSQLLTSTTSFSRCFKCKNLKGIGFYQFGMPCIPLLCDVPLAVLLVLIERCKEENCGSPPWARGSTAPAGWTVQRRQRVWNTQIHPDTWKLSITFSRQMCESGGVFPHGEFVSALLEPDQTPAPSLSPANRCEEPLEPTAIRCSIFLFSSASNYILFIYVWKFERNFYHFLW